MFIEFLQSWGPKTGHILNYLFVFSLTFYHFTYIIKELDLSVITKFLTYRRESDILDNSTEKKKIVCFFTRKNQRKNLNRLGRFSVKDVKT